MRYRDHQDPFSSDARDRDRYLDPIPRLGTESDSLLDPYRGNRRIFLEFFFLS